MVDGYETALQKGLIAALKANAGVAAMVGTRIYDTPPQRVIFPYLRLRNFNSAPWDTDDTIGHEVVFALEAHSRPSKRGSVEAKRVKEVSVAALHRGETVVAVAGFELVELIFLTSTNEEAADGKSYVDRMAFQALLDT